MRAAAFIGVVLALIAVLALAGVRRAEEIGAAEASRGGGFGAVPVAVAQVRAMELADVVEALGTARANESVVITPQVTDIVSRVAFDSGDVVEEGQVMVELADAEEAADLAESRSALAEAERELERFVDLSRRGVAPQSQIDELRSGVDRAGSRVRSLEARLSDRLIRAPFAGVVGLRNTSSGALVRPGDPIATLDDISLIKLDFSVPEGFIGVLERGVSIAARSAAYDDEIFDGVVTQIDSRVDPVTRTVVVRAEIDNEDGRLLPGMLMLVELRRNPRQARVTPELAVLREGSDAFVYVIAEDGDATIAMRRAVRTGSRSGGMIEILEGLELGERVVAEGVNRVRPGAPVRVAEEIDEPPEARGATSASSPATAGDER